MLARQGARTGPAGLKRNLCNRTRLAALAAPPEAPVTVVNRRSFPSMLPPTYLSPTYLSGGLEQGEGSATLLLGAVLDCMCSRTARR